MPASRAGALFECDGEYRSKIGPVNATPVIGSYNDEEHILTLLQYNKPAPGDEAARAGI